MADTYPEKGVAQQNDPAIGAIAISYGGGNQTFDGNCRGFYISSAGHLAVVMANGSAITFSNLLAGSFYPFKITQVTQSGSTAAGVLLF